MCWRILLFTLIVSAVATAETEIVSERPLVVPLRIRVARCDGEAVRSPEWVQTHIEGAREIFGRHGITLQVQVDGFEPSQCELVGRAARHRLARFVDSRQATVLVVKRVEDLDVPSYNLMGVHWRYRGQNKAFRGRRWVLLTGRSRPPVLAHELCHYFGLHHDRAGGNLMAPGPSDPIFRSDGPKPAPFKPILRPWQVKALRRGIERFLQEQSATPVKSTFAGVRSGKVELE